ncbi:MAG: GntR family transcriptional regulator [Desulfohalobiaceae bacterium]|nr:GntR family transcriptional regulator [Desulfohalobiaceae bacterium]
MPDQQRLKHDEQPNLRPVDQPESLKQIAYRAMHKALMAGELKQGEIYKEKELSKLLSTSRTPVREALLELAAKGMVTFLPRKGVLINQFDVQDLNEIFELRKALELAAVEKVARIIADNDLEKLQAVLDEQRTSAEENNVIRFLDLDRRFHTLLSAMTNNRRLVESLETIRDLLQVMSAKALAAEGRLEEVIREHETVLQAVAAKDPGLARKKMDLHLEESRKKTEAGMTGSPPPIL